MEPMALGHGIGFRCHVPDGPLPFQSDGKKVRQILLNLVTNAIKFTPQGKVSVSLAKMGDDLIFQTSDTGTGIAREHQEKIFEAFWQVENSPTRAAGGTGLGLSVSRRLARLLGGDITVESEMNHGSTFTLRIPTAPQISPATSNSL